MAGKQKLTPAQVTKSLQKYNGLQAAAARELNVARSTIANYIDRYPAVKAAYDDTNESNIDMVEGKLMTEINKGNITAIIFFLKTKARHRGYIEHVKHEGTGDGGALVIESKIDDERFDRAISSLTDAIREGLSGKGSGEKRKMGTTK